MPMIKLQSSEGEIFPVDVEVACKSLTIKTMLEDLGMEAETDEAVPIGINSAILKKTLQWLAHHKDDPAPPVEKDEDVFEEKEWKLSSWDQDFLKVDQDTLFQLIYAANFLDIKDLVATACKGVSNIIKGKNVKEIRNIFNIKCDISHERFAEIRKGNEWARAQDK